jgi:5-bromo-4-chloroindolyl phosphate hydrolysis protein
MKKHPKPSKKEIDFLYAMLENVVDLRHSSNENEKRKEKARAILDRLVDLV